MLVPLSRTWRVRWLATVVLFALALLLADTELGRELEWKAEDRRLRWRAQDGPAPHEALLLVAVDDESVENIGRWPFERALHGMLVDWLGRDEPDRPSVLAWDLLFVDASFDPRSDEAFATPLAAAPFPVVLGSACLPDPEKPGAGRGLVADGAIVEARGVIGRVSEEPALAVLPDQGEALLPIPALGVSRVGLLDAEPDADGVVRRIPFVVRVGDEVLPSLVLETLLAHWRLGPEAVRVRPGVAVEITRTDGGVLAVPIDERGLFRLNYRHEVAEHGGVGGVPALGYHSLSQLLMRRHEFGEADAARPATGGRIVMVGQTAVGLTDIGPSPLRGRSAKVMVHLNALDNVLQGDFLRGFPVWAATLAWLAAGAGLALILDRGNMRWFAVAATGTALALTAGAFFPLKTASVMVPLAVPGVVFAVQQLVFAVLKVREEQARRARIRGMFATYVAPALVDRMVQSGEEPRLGGVEEEITAYFSDIESFSSFSEVLPPDRLVELMNEYLSACTDIVQAEGGTLDKYIGDAVVAMYGAPLPLPGHGHRAVLAALRVQARCAELREKWRAEQATKGWPDLVTRLRTRIGLNLGRAVVGNMGSHTRFNYTMMGDTVNLAARLESGAKAYGVYTLVSEAVVQASLAMAPGAVLFRPLDRIVVKGRSRPVAIHEAMGLAGDVSPQTRECAELFAAGLARYFAADWAGARARFQDSARLEQHVENNPSRVLLARLDELEKNPPPGHWDGVYVMKSK